VNQPFARISDCSSTINCQTASANRSSSTIKGFRLVHIMQLILLLALLAEASALLSQSRLLQQSRWTHSPKVPSLQIFPLEDLSELSRSVQDVKEASRKQCQTVYKPEDWKQHRSCNRYFRVSGS
jgi:hypothetical protein